MLLPRQTSQRKIVTTVPGQMLFVLHWIIDYLPTQQRPIAFVNSTLLNVRALGAAGVKPVRVLQTSGLSLDI